MPLTFAAKLRLHWLKLYCSDVWIKTAFLPLDRDGIWWEIRSTLYPPGQEETAMRSCAECGRVCPPNGLSSICCDCEAERDDEPFWERVNNDPDLARELYFLRPRSISYRRFMEGEDDWEPVATTSNAPEDSKETATATGWAGATLEACGTARTCLERHQGCQIVLLPESYKALKKEIKHYKKKLKKAKKKAKKKKKRGERVEIKKEDMIKRRASPNRRFEAQQGFGAR